MSHALLPKAQAFKKWPRQMHCMLFWQKPNLNGISGIIVSDGKPSMVKYVIDSVGAVICCFALVGATRNMRGLILLRMGHTHIPIDHVTLAKLGFKVNHQAINKKLFYTFVDKYPLNISV